MTTGSQLLQNIAIATCRSMLHLSPSIIQCFYQSKLFKIVAKYPKTSRLQLPGLSPSYQQVRPSGGTSSICCQHKCSICSLVVTPPPGSSRGGLPHQRGSATQTFPVSTHRSSRAFSRAKSAAVRFTRLQCERLPLLPEVLCFLPRVSITEHSMIDEISMMDHQEVGNVCPSVRKIWLEIHSKYPLYSVSLSLLYLCYCFSGNYSVRATKTAVLVL